MRSKAITQLALVIVSIVIIVTYIRPTFDDMERIRNEAETYQTALDNANSYNMKLRELYDQTNSFSVTERRVLNRFMPKEIDAIAVMRDIETIAQNHSIPLTALSSSDAVLGTVNTQQQTAAQGQVIEKQLPVTVQKFQLNVSATYDQFKTFLHDLERNAYLLEVANLSVEPSDDDLYSFGLTLEAYSLVNETE